MQSGKADERGTVKVESILMIVAMFGVLYFFMIRPENKRKKQAQEMRDSLKKGDVVTSIGGIVGKVVHVKPNTIIIETSEDRVRMELTKWGVSSIGVQESEQAQNVDTSEEKPKLNASQAAEETSASDTASAAKEEK